MPRAGPHGLVVCLLTIEQDQWKPPEIQPPTGFIIVDPVRPVHKFHGKKIGDLRFGTGI